MEKSSLIPNFFLIFLFLYFGLVIEGEEKFSNRQVIYIILNVSVVILLVYINRETLFKKFYSKKTETKRSEATKDEVKDFIE